MISDNALMVAVIIAVVFVYMNSQLTVDNSAYTYASQCSARVASMLTDSFRPETEVSKSVVFEGPEERVLHEGPEGISARVAASDVPVGDALPELFPPPTDPEFAAQFQGVSHTQTSRKAALAAHHASSQKRISSTNSKSLGQSVMVVGVCGKRTSPKPAAESQLFFNAGINVPAALADRHDDSVEGEEPEGEEL